ncbi:MAG: hypothetical protein J6336_00895, partial [Kiritimatiellae bacterium]|nr:hypothetical protein [Kiritimatiellia bacterium]
WTYKVSFVVTGEGSNQMTFSFYIPFGDTIFNPGTDYAGTKPGFRCLGWFEDGDTSESLVQFATGESAKRVPQNGITFRQKWVADGELTSAQQFQGLGSTYGMIAGISAGSAGATTLSAKGRTLLAPTAQARRYTVRHAVYAAYPYYTVLRCDDLANPVWTAAEDSRKVTGVGATAVDIPVEGKRGFFRLLMSTEPLTKGATKLGE